MTDEQRQFGGPRVSIENCQKHLRQQGGSYPRTCGVCGLMGPCRYYESILKPLDPPLPVDPKDEEIARLKAKLAAIQDILRS